jgi:hypothetical protein
VAVLSLGKATFSSKAGINAYRGSGENKTPDISQTDGTELLNIKIIASKRNLISAYELIKSKPGNMTPGVEREVTLDGIETR